MHQKTSALYVTAKSTGLEINTNKTKSLRINTHNTAAITINGKSIEDVNNFTYLGSIVSKHGGANKDIRARLGKARHAFITLRPIKRQISSTVRFRNLETD